jgi:hypothetical protein
MHKFVKNGRGKKVMKLRFIVLGKFGEWTVTVLYGAGLLGDLVFTTWIQRLDEIHLVGGSKN